MKIFDLKVNKREKTGKEVSNKLRKEGKVPAVFYGHDIKTVALTVDVKELFNLTHGNTRGSILVNLNFEGEEKSHTAIIKQVEKHPIKESLIHIDFQKVKMDEKINSTVPVNIIGEEEAVGIEAGGVLQHGIWEIEISALPKNLPEGIDADITELDIGDSIKVGDLIIPQNIDVLSDDEEVVLSIIPPTTYEEEVVEEEEELEAAEEGEEKPEGEEAEEGKSEEGKSEEEKPEEPKYKKYK
ncbi:MAG: 50S ribosomal protein L25 [Actinomycetia bacterium]|nr:50S ribosomal protein L25 [Actinomycetes bacterium]